MNDDIKPPATSESSLEKLITSLESDFFLFSGPINYQNAGKFLDMVEKQKHRENVVLILATFGGDAGAAYRMARFLKKTYSVFRLLVFGFCKSAGTLLALGADEIIMGKRAEFGPLDVQLIKADEFTETSSGLDVSIALEEIGHASFGIMEKVLLELKQRSGGAITTRTAAEIAKSMAVGLLTPITEQIDPLRLGETKRAMKIAHQYGVQLGADEKILKHLTEDYPSHDFVIDLDEAKELFENVRETDEVEIRLEKDLRRSLSTKNQSDCLRIPSENKLTMGPMKPPAKEEIQNANTQKERPGTPQGGQDKPPQQVNNNPKGNNHPTEHKPGETDFTTKARA